MALCKKKKSKNRRYPTETITDVDHADDIVFLANIPTQAESPLHSLACAEGGICLHVWRNEEHVCQTKSICFKREGAISTQRGGPQKIIKKVMRLSSRVSSTENNVDRYLAKASTVNNTISIKWKSDLSNKIKWDFFQGVSESILLYRSTTWSLIKLSEK